MPVIPAIREAEMAEWQFKATWGKILVRSYFKSKLDMVVHACVPSFVGGGDRRLIGLRPDRAKVRPYLKDKLKQKGLGAWFKIVKHLALQSKPRILYFFNSFLFFFFNLPAVTVY
jgi:hypothetical protein